TGYIEVLLDGLLSDVTIRGSSLGVSPNAGLMQNSTDTTLRWVTVTTYVIPYGSYPGEVQGVSGTAGPGMQRQQPNLGNYQLDPFGVFGITRGGVFNDSMKFVPSDMAAGFNQLYI